MKFRWDKKYLYWCITALFAILGGIGVFYFAIFYSNFFLFFIIRLFFLPPIPPNLIIW